MGIEALKKAEFLKEEEKRAEPSTEFQAEVIGNRPFRRRLPPGSSFFQTRLVRLGMVNKDGQTIFPSLEKLPPNIDPSEYPHVTIKQVEETIDAADEGSPKMSTTRKKGASYPYVDTQADIRHRGGDNQKSDVYSQGGFLTDTKALRRESKRQKQRNRNHPLDNF